MEAEAARSEMEETYLWREQIREAVIQLGVPCRRAREHLLLASPLLERPWVTRPGGDAAESGAGLVALAEERLVGASASLSVATVRMDAAELLALRCSGERSPAAAPIDVLLHGGDDDDDESIPVWRALFKLQEAGARAEDAFGAVERCRGHLVAAALLLGHPAVPGADDCIEAERVAAVDALEAAAQLAEEVDALVSDAWRVLGLTASSETPLDSESEDP